MIIVFKRFLEQFPTLSDLADASNKEVIIAWRGMGYNSRALRLRDAARWIRDRDRVRNEYNPSPNPVFPSSMEELQTIPGIGHYTAGAIRNFAFGIPTPCIDTNIRRILHRVFDASLDIFDFLFFCDRMLLAFIAATQFFHMIWS
jgi:A/G-specific adenine glycosylase